MFVRHEDFLADPGAVTRQILAMVGSDADLPDLDALVVQAPLQGNQLIRAERVAVRRSDGSPPSRDSFTSVLQAVWRPLLARMQPAARPSLDTAGESAAGDRRDTSLTAARS